MKKVILILVVLFASLLGGYLSPHSGYHTFFLVDRTPFSYSRA